jgi:lipopolysaccharide export LptBFGC system permease protein LptF
VFVGFPLALSAPRQSGARGFIFALAAMFALYIVRSVFISLGQGGLLTFGGLLPYDVSIACATILPAVTLIFLGVWLIRKKSYQL